MEGIHGSSRGAKDDSQIFSFLSILNMRKTGVSNARKEREAISGDGPKREDGGFGRMKIEAREGGIRGKEMTKRDPDRGKIIKTGADVIGKGAEGGEREGGDKTAKKRIKSNDKEERTKRTTLTDSRSNKNATIGLAFNPQMVLIEGIEALDGTNDKFRKTKDTKDIPQIGLREGGEGSLEVKED